MRETGSARRPFAALCLPLCLGLGCCCLDGSRSDERERAEVYAPYVLAALPPHVAPLDLRFGEDVHLVGVEAPEGPIAAGETLSITLYWKVTRRLVGGWALFTHVLGERGDRVANGDHAGPLREDRPGRPPLGPSFWKPGRVYKDTVEVRLPEHVTGRLRVVAGIWRGAERLPVTGSGLSADAEHRLLVAEVTVERPLARILREQIPELTVPRREGAALSIDGVLDEPAWQTAAVTRPFVDVGTGGDAGTADPRGSARLLWDDTHLYLGFSVVSTKILGGFAPGSKDAHLWEHECVEIMIDPDGDGDGLDYYEIQVSPQNLVFDSRFESYNFPRGGPLGPFGHEAWSARGETAVKLAGTIDDDTDADSGYTVEVSLPFAQLDRSTRVQRAAPPRPGEAWRVNLYIMKRNAGVAWSPILGQGNFHRASRFGRLLFE